MRTEEVVRRNCWSSKVMKIGVDLANRESLVVRMEVTAHARSTAPIQAHGRDKGTRSPTHEEDGSIEARESSYRV
jgi:hypothetical protein